jgi:hypothetical protein
MKKGRLMDYNYFIENIKLYTKVKHMIKYIAILIL